MNNNNFNNNNNNNLEVSIYDPKAKKTDGRRKRQKVDSSSSSSENRRGQWSKARRIAMFKAYTENTPYGVPFKQRTEQWQKVTDAVNKVDTELNSFKLRAIRDSVKGSFSDYEYLFTKVSNEKESGTNRFENPEVDLPAYEAWTQVNSQIQLKAILIYNNHTFFLKHKYDKKLSEDKKVQRTEFLEEKDRIRNEALKMSLGVAQKIKSKDKGKEKKATTSGSNETDQQISGHGSVPEDPIEIDSSTHRIVGSYIEKHDKKHTELLDALKLLHEDNQKIIDALVQLTQKPN